MLANVPETLGSIPSTTYNQVWWFASSWEIKKAGRCQPKLHETPSQKKKKQYIWKFKSYYHINNNWHWPDTYNIQEAIIEGFSQARYLTPGAEYILCSPMFGSIRELSGVPIEHHLSASSQMTTMSTHCPMFPRGKTCPVVGNYSICLKCISAYTQI